MIGVFATAATGAAPLCAGPSSDAAHRCHRGDLGRVVVLGSGADAQALATALGGELPGRFVGTVAAEPGRGLTATPVAAPAGAVPAARRLGADTAILAAPELAGPREAEIAIGLYAAGMRVLRLSPWASLIAPPRALWRHLRPVFPVSGHFPSSPVSSGAWNDPRSDAVSRWRADALAVDARPATVLVTGGAGTVGRAVGRRLLGLGLRRVVLFDACEYALDRALRELRTLADPSGVEVAGCLASVTDAGSVSRSIRRYGADTVIHAAACKHVPIAEADPDAAFRTNGLGTLEAATAAREAGVARFVLVSTDKAVRPAGAMGASKRLAETLVRDLAARPGGTVFSVVRFGNVIGSSGSLVERVADSIAAGAPVTLTDPSASRYFMTADEAADLIVEAAVSAFQGDVFAFEMGAPHRIVDIAARMLRAAGREADTIRFSGLRPGEKLHEEMSLGQARPAGAGGESRLRRLDDAQPAPLLVASLLRDLRDALESGSEAGLARLVRRIAAIDGEAPGAAVPQRSAEA